MTQEQQQQALVEAQQAGIDLNLLDLNLSLSVAERWRRHDEALALVVQLETARKLRDDTLQPAPAAHR